MPTVTDPSVEENGGRFRKEISVEDGSNQFYRRVSLVALPNDVLLEIFYFYLDPPQCHHSSFIAGDASLDAWHTLVHVCQRWRYTVLASPRYLDLRLHCTNKTPAKTMLDIWPEFPIVVSYHASPNSRPRGIQNVIAALQCNHRVCEINLFGVPKSLLKRSTALKVAFPALTSLRVSSESDDNEGWSVLPDSFLGQYATCLRSIDLHGISFPALQKLLLHSKDLVTLRLERIPISWYISSEEMATCLSTLTKLEEVAIGFLPPLFPWHQLNQHHVPPATRSVLNSLTSLRFRGDCWYLEALISRILLPQLNNVDITFAVLPIIQPVFHAPLLCELISSTEAFEAPHRADLSFHPHFVNVTLSQPEDMINRTLKLGVLCRGSELQRSYLAQLCNFTLPPLPTLEHLHIHCSFVLVHRLNEMDNTQWLHILRPFTSVKNLCLSDQLVPYVARALQGLSGERVTEVLPALQNIFLPGLKPAGAVVIGKFLAARQLSGRTVSVHN